MRSKKENPQGALQASPQEMSLPLYLKDIGSSKPLSSKDEAALAARIRAGDSDALHTLVKANLRFVVSVSRTYQNQGLPLADLINEGNLGLIEAAKRFDERKNFRFISYAVWWIRQAILQLLAERSRIIRLPLNRVGYLHKIGVCQRRLEQKLQRLPTTEEIARDLDTKVRDVQKMIAVGARASSLDTWPDDGTPGLYNVISANDEEDDVERWMYNTALSKKMTQLLETLDGREREIISLYFGIGHGMSYTLEEIGNRYKITRERVRQIRQKALAKLQRSSVNKDLRTFLHR